MFGKNIFCNKKIIYHLFILSENIFYRNKITLSFLKGFMITITILNKIMIGSYII